MEGESFYEIGSEEKSRIEKFFSNIFQSEQSAKKTENPGFLKNIIKKYFN